MSHKNYLFWVVMSASFLLTSATIYSNPVSLGGAGIGNVVNLQNGATTFETFDRGELEAKFLDLLSERQKEDRDYILDAVEKLDAAFADLIESDLMVVQDLANRSSAGGEIIDYKEFFSATKNLKSAELRIQNKIKTLTALPSIVGSAPAAQLEGSVVSIPNYGNMDFSPLIEHYTTQLNEQMAAARALRILVSLPNGQTKYVEKLEVKTDQPLTAAQLNEMRNEAAMLRIIEDVDARSIDTYNQFTKASIYEFIRTFGISQKRRLDLNSEGMAKTLQALEEAFWTRSYLRSVYGVQLGTFAIEYNKQQLNWDFFASSNSLQFVSEFVRDTNELIAFQDKIYTALITQESRSKKLIGEEISLLAGINSFKTMLAGDRSLAKANSLILKLMLADLEEELIVSKGGGLKEMREHYRKRYYKSEDEKSYFKEKAAAYNGGDAEDIEADTITTDTNSLKGAFQIAKLGLENFMQQVEQAVGIEEALEQLNANNRTQQRVRARQDI
ncbi:MAG: hypothetical protein A2504_01875 [Bdellovibrionales bacterium RIFOXYD12_FULL_39_22]|nr:MAG: hypothetical protein A2385_04400 [Bdellovibrionales bacterium RIFOXYB1_FULL_39_21]OFZ42345.1 MAG: hypothetical protein A2485_15095 [Bdellovibrionales bacterium RIFOXYC12_FULL_39_17]OFZ46354.1 MAG: hypothetical protein A2404_13920 [Bdellovibrionales bacterium RIFOXYC1_FULL_39_130]OFZ72802.1 MAG: hypothetical protein A2451_13010 [Bdellovibrionales bacterium RIFOXYC2_FULL_39_8]OFZ75247.1 MAG: hypothetical protein A2560_15975 [Bdellovibrionales bacterium RIFOXYD1_FULL_39_84]OFZ93241.1 MAG: